MQSSMRQIGSGGDMYLPAILGLFIVMTSCSGHQSSSIRNERQVGTPENLPSYCLDASVRRISVPVFSDQSDSKMVELAFQEITDSDPDAPTIIVIPGGPGGTSIGTWSDYASRLFGALPSEGFHFIMTDPRGAGCNVNLDIPDESLKTRYLADDVLAIINARGLKNYYLKGHSYGSALATVIAAKAEADAAVPPKGLVLSGVVGRAFTMPEMLNERGPPQWDKLFVSLPEKTRRKLSSSPLPFNAPEEAWVSYIQEMLTEGKGFVGGKYFQPKMDLLLALETEEPDQLKMLRQEVWPEDITPPHAVPTSTPATGDTGMQRLFSIIGCQELFPTMSIKPSFIKAKLTFTREPAYECDNFLGLRMTDPFDSKMWQISSSIFYFQGEEDPDVPLFQAEYHAFNHPSVKRFFVTVPGAGHSPLDANLLDCRDKIWASVKQRGDGLESALETCGSKTRLKIL